MWSEVVEQQCKELMTEVLTPPQEAHNLKETALKKWVKYTPQLIFQC